MRLTPAPTTPTSNEICAPNRTREKRSRPWRSVPNQCCADGGANWASESWSGLWAWAKLEPAIFKISGHAMITSKRKARNQALTTAGRLRLKRSQAICRGPLRMPSPGAPASRRPAAIREPELAGGTPALPGIALRLRDSVVPCPWPLAVCSVHSYFTRGSSKV